MIYICTCCLHIGLGHYDRPTFRKYAPIVANTSLLLVFSSQYKSVEVMFQMMKILEFSVDKIITALSYEDSCSKCQQSRTMIDVYSEVGQRLVLKHYSHLLKETVTITVHEPS